MQKLRIFLYVNSFAELGISLKALDNVLFIKGELLELMNFSFKGTCLFRINKSSKTVIDPHPVGNN